MSAILNLMQQSLKDRLETIAEGIGHIVENLRRLREAAKVLHDAGHGQTAQIMAGFADEEAAKVLILVDVVRCPPSRQADLRRTVGYFDKHLAKRIYAEACRWRPTWFEELKAYAESATRSHYLDGPKDVDWIFPNDFKGRREREIYVDYIKDVTEEDGEYLWMTPFPDNSFRMSYVQSAVVSVAEALWCLGAGSTHGLDVVREEWLGFDPELNDSIRNHRNRVARTLDRLGQNTGGTDDENAGVVMRNWPFPMWSLDLSEETRAETKSNLAELREIRKDQIAQFEKIASVREPALQVTADLVEELAKAYDESKEERARLEDEHARKEAAEAGGTVDKRQGKLRIRRMLAVENPLFSNLKRRLQSLSVEERADLVALAWLTRDHIADWARVRARAAGMIESMDFTYQAGLGNAWREGYSRWTTVRTEFKPGELRM